jgi:hypothetical protein
MSKKPSTTTTQVKRRGRPKKSASVDLSVVSAVDSTNSICKEDCKCEVSKPSIFESVRRFISNLIESIKKAL